MADERQYCTFYLDRLFLGVEVERVQEVIRYQEMTRVPLSAPEVRGLINLRGQIVTAIDLRRRLGLPERTDEELPMNVVIRSDDGAVSLLVDHIGDVLEVRDEQYEPPPDSIPGLARQLITGVYKLEKSLLLVLDTDRAVTIESSSRSGAGAALGEMARRSA